MSNDDGPVRQNGDLRLSWELAEAIVDTVREPMVVLDPDLVVQHVNDSFYRTFRVSAGNTVGRRIYQLGNGQWDIPALRVLLEKVLPNDRKFDDYSVTHDFPELGRRTMLLNARRIDHVQLILLAIEDITEREGEARLRLALEAGGMGTWDMDLRSGYVVWDDRQYEVCGFEPGDENAPLGLNFLKLVHPDDRAGVQHIVEGDPEGEPEFHHEFRIVRPDGKVRWLASQGGFIKNHDGRPARLIGVSWDITDRKHGEERERLLGEELQHRVKNMLSTVQAIMSQTLKHAQSLEQFSQDFSGRLKALARGTDLLIRSHQESIDLEELLSLALEPYGDMFQISVRGDGMRLGPNTALTISLIVHELATNAAKYGALSVPDGRVEIDCSPAADMHGIAVCKWRELGGPPVKPPHRRGFGSRLIERSAKYELGGDAKIHFRPEGVECVIRFPFEEPARATVGK